MLVEKDRHSCEEDATTTEGDRLDLVRADAPKMNFQEEFYERDLFGSDDEV